MSFFFIDDDPGGVSSVTYVGMAESTASTITIPATAQTGDIALLYDLGQGNSTPPALVTPSGGWANRVDSALSTLRAAVATKVLVDGDAGSAITGMAGIFANTKTILVFRPDVPITAATYSTFTTELTNGDPAAQVVSASGQPAPVVIVLGGCGYTGGPVFSSASPAFDAEIVPTHNRVRIGYKLYAGSPSDHTINENDLGSLNHLWGGYIALS